MKRNSWCGEINKEHLGKEIVLNGWIQKRRDHGGLIFVDLRDRTGIVQTVFAPNTLNTKFELASTLRGEDVIAIKGIVLERPHGSVNNHLDTGQVEIEVLDFVLINKAKPTPFLIEDDIDTKEEIRLRYRYLDLRRPQMFKKILFRHKVGQVMRSYLNAQGFIDIETPFLTRSTPEGARDYLVPSRESPGNFFALPQSPQLFKQLLMVAGFEKYYQLARCFRDEDLRGDRQPEFTQLDIEMSFTDEEEIFCLIEGMIKKIGQDLDLPFDYSFPRITYQEAMERYGSDKPDIRFAMELKNISSCFSDTIFQVFANILNNGGRIQAINFPGGAHLTRSEIASLEEIAKNFGLAGLAWISFQEDDIKSSIKKFLPEPIIGSIKEEMHANAGDLVLIAAGQTRTVLEALGQVRLHLGKKYNLYKKGIFKFLWVTEFPLLQYDEDAKRYVAEHHAFTMPNLEDIPILEKHPDKIRARAYDFVVNGVELASGSIRIHEAELQNRIFSLLSLTPEESNEKFGFLLQAFQFGAPPHGGIAFGFDRLVMILTGDETIREVIAFPKTGKAACLMTEAPNRVNVEQLNELGLKIELPPSNLPK